MPRSDASSWQSSPVVLDECAALWAAVLSRLGTGYPLSPYAKMGRADVEADGALWAQEMRDVPADAIGELYQRTCRRRALSKDAGFPPNIGDFRAAWLDPEWDYWARENADDEVGALALPAPPAEGGPGARTALAQNEHRRRTGEYVCCRCLNEYGFQQTAALSLGETRWVCAVGLCGFEAEVSGPSREPGEG